MSENQIEALIDDQRESGNKLTTTKSLVKLRKNQQAAVRAMSKCDAGILHAPTAFGKTVAAIGMITERKANTVSDLVQDYGHVIVDECHHVSAPRFEMVLNEVRAKYVLGLTATPEWSPENHLYGSRSYSS